MSLFDIEAPQNSEQSKEKPRKYLKDLQVGEKVDTHFKVMNINKRSKKDGSPFLSLEVMDKTDKIPAKAWNNAEQYFSFLSEGGIYRISGSVTEYMGQKEIKIDGIKAPDTSTPGFCEEDFKEQAAFDTTTVSNEMINILKSNITNPHLLQLIELFSSQYEEKFRNHYGAQKIHHAYMGGLLEHTLSMMKLAVFCADHYDLDKELLLMGVLFHDIGKMFEFTITPTIESTIEGGLLGHLIIGNTIFIQLKDKISGFPEELSLKIQHMIISHHGEKEFGSPEVPKLPEAFVLHILDLLDSKLKIVEETLDGTESKGLFSDYVKVLGRRLYLPPKEQ